jgi:hypothetical protein
MRLKHCVVLSSKQIFIWIYSKKLKGKYSKLFKCPLKVIEDDDDKKNKKYKNYKFIQKNK